MAETLLHIISRDEWERARRHGVVAPPSLESQGFVHLSTAHQVHLPANRLYSGRADLLLLHVDPARLGHPVRYEAGVPEDPESMRFPHLYGPLPVDAVVEVTVYEPGADGSFAPCERRGADGVGPQD
ncbi:DUF952 domain-containing protein [Rhodococcus sp. CH91]|uniref:DUF952 domain-containing protein n=1 Tax=Rhodococcus sp. CH91 TaxID=2910256 RepID=UPI001F4A2158|nr:DUF952 domain-containing protein [Rhodococcus sp. CH91]